MTFLFDPHFQAVDANGLPLVGATLGFYRGGTNDLITIYQDADADTPLANPVTADAAGTFAPVFLNTIEPYKFVLKTAAGVTIRTLDDIPVEDAFPRLSRAGIKALDTTLVTVAYCTEEGREGFFSWRAGNYSANITGDTNEAFFIKADDVASSAGAWVRTVNQVSTPRTAGQSTDGADNLSNNVFVGPAGYWDPDGATVTREPWVVGVDNPPTNVNFWSLHLKGHYIDPNAYGAVIYGGMPNYYSAVGPKALLSHTSGKDNYNGHISGLLLSDHSDLVDDGSVNLIGDHGTILGGAYHIAAGTMPAIVGGTSTQVWADKGFMGAGQDNIIGRPDQASQISSHSGMVAGTGNSSQGRYNFVGGGLSHDVTGIFSVAVGGWNNTVTGTINNTSEGGSAAVGGRDHVLLGGYSGALGGQYNKTETTAIGAQVLGTRAVARERFSLTQASGRFASDGDAQSERVFGFGTGTTNINIQIAGGVLSLKGLLTGEVSAYSILICGARTGTTGEYFAYRVEGIVQNVSGTPAIASSTITVIFESDASYNPVPYVSGGRFGINISGNSSKTTRFVAQGEFVSLLVT